MCSLFHVIAEQCSIVWIYYNLSLYSPADSPLDYFQSLAIMNEAAMNIHIQLFVQDTCFHSSQVSI